MKQLNMEEIREKYTKEQRFETVYPGFLADQTPYLIRQVRESGLATGFINYVALQGGDIDQIIEGEIDYFRQKGVVSFEWKLHDYDWPADLGERLEAHQFTKGEKELIMVIDLEQLPDSLTGGREHIVSEVIEQEGLKLVDQIESAVWGHKEGWIEHLTQSLMEHRDQFSIYLVHASDGTAASCGWSHMPTGKQFCSLWGGSTLEAYRKQGLYHTLVQVRLEEAKERGFRYAYIDAGPMSAPILTRLGFRQMAVTYPYLYQIDSNLSKSFI